MGRHKVKDRNPFAGDVRELEGYGKAMLRKKYTPVAQPRLAKVKESEVLL